MIHLILTAGLSAGLGSLILSAQDQKAVADIPFAFQASNHTLAAGEYTISETSARGLFTLRDSESKALFVMAPINSTGESGNPRLVFRCYGNERVLSQIWTSDGTGYRVSDSAVEKSLHRRIQMAALVSVRLTPR
jgi:hypothetical protein